MDKPASAGPTEPDEDDQRVDHAPGDTAKAEPDEHIEELPDDAPSSTPAQAAEHFCERCGRTTYYADGTWWHAASGTVDCPDVSQWWAVQPNWYG